MPKIMFSCRPWNDPELIFGMEWPDSATKLVVCHNVLMTVLFTFASLTPFLEFNLQTVLSSRQMISVFSFLQVFLHVEVTFIAMNKNSTEDVSTRSQLFRTGPATEIVALWGLFVLAGPLSEISAGSISASGPARPSHTNTATVLEKTRHEPS